MTLLINSEPTPLPPSLKGGGRSIGFGITRILLFLIRGYQVVSGLFPPRCRFTPTCSNYMAQALEQHGLFSGVGLGLQRLLRCHPWHPGGHDPVPTRLFDPSPSLTQHEH